MCPDRFFYFFGFSTTPPQKIWSSVLQPSEIPFFGLNFQKTAPGGGGRCVYLMDSPKGTMPALGVTAQLTHFRRTGAFSVCFSSTWSGLEFLKATQGSAF